MKNNLVGFVISALLHVGLMILIINLGNSQPTKPPEPVSIPLTLAMFEPTPDPIMPVEVEPEPLPETKVDPIIEPEQVKKIEPEVIPVLEPKSEPKPEPKLKPRPKKKKVVKKKVKKKLKKRKEKKKDPEMERLVRAIMNPPKQTKPQPAAKPRSRQPVRSPLRHVRHVPKTATTAQKPKRPVQRSVSRRVAPQRTRPAVNHAQAGRAEAAYRSRLNQLLSANKRYPKRAKRMGKQGTVKVSFTVLRNGTIQNIRLVNSSGNSTLDSAALRAVKSISGKLPFPKEIKKSQWVFTVPVIYQLR